MGGVNDGAIGDVVGAVIEAADGAIDPTDVLLTNRSHNTLDHHLDRSITERVSRKSESMKMVSLIG